MNAAIGSGRTGGSDDDRTFVWLILALVVALVVVAGLAFVAGSVANQTAQIVASLGLTGPAGRPTIPTPVAAATPQPTLSPQAATTPPAPVSAFAPGTEWFFADSGSLGSFNSSSLASSFVVVNINDAPVQVQMTVPRGDAGTSQPVSFTVKAQTRLSLAAITGPSAAVRFAGTAPFFVERVSQSGKDALSSTGTLPSATWYLPLVESRFGYDDLLALANFNGAPARVTVNYLSGSITQTMAYTVAANARLTVSMTQQLSVLSSVRPGTPRGAVVNSDLPIVAGQITTLDGGGAGYDTGGRATLSRAWYLPEGNTRSGAETTVAILNPGPSPARLLVTYLPEGRQPVIKSYTVGAASPLHLNLNVEMPDAAVAISVESDQPVAVSRVTYLGGGAGAHASIGASATAKDWILPEAGTAPPSLAFLIIMNPGTDAADITVTLYGEEGKPLEKRLSVPAASRFALALEKEVPPAALSARVTSSQPVVVERVTYLRGSSGAMASMGIPW
jgi:hypothetical protein